jgi:hypothetical protein
VHLPSATYFEKQVHIDDKGFCVFTFSKTCIKLQAPTQNLQIVHDVSWISDRTSHVSVYVLDTSREHNVDLHMKLANLILYFSHRSIISCDSLCSTWHIMCLPKYAIKTLLICVPCAFYRLPSLFGKTCWVSLRRCGNCFINSRISRKINDNWTRNVWIAIYTFSALLPPIPFNWFRFSTTLY